MGFVGKIARRVAAIGTSALVLGGLCVAAHPAIAGPTAPTLQNAVMEWRDSLQAWSAFTEERRHERSKEFMHRFDAFEIAVICRECAKDPRLGVDGAAFLRARFALLPPGAEELAAMFRDVTLGVPCHVTALQSVSRNRNALTPAEGETLAAAMLALADRADYTDDLRRQLEEASAYLSTSDRILERIRSKIVSNDPKERENGFTTAENSRDPRVTGFLTDLLDRLRARDETPSTRLMVVYATKAGRAGYDRIHAFYDRIGDADFKLRALGALCSTTDPRAMHDLLTAYGDETTGIRDSTSQLPDSAARTRYQRLWSYSRILEPTLVETLGGEDSLLAATAIEIADRGSRFGPPIVPGELENALRRFAASPGQGAARAQRANAIVARIELRVHERLRAGSGGR